MTIDKVRPLPAEHGLPDRLHEFEESTATAEPEGLVRPAGWCGICKTPEG